MRAPAYVCGPYRGAVAENTARATRLAMWAVGRGYAPIVPHIHNLVYLGEANPGQADDLAIECGVILARAVARAGGSLFIIERDDNTLSAGCQAELAAFLGACEDWGRVVRRTWAEWAPLVGGVR